jgi:hypothetical protein
MGISHIVYYYLESSVNTAVFSMSSGPGSLFNVDKYAQNAIAASSVASGLGIACDAWFLLRYNWADLHTFRVRPFYSRILVVPNHHYLFPRTEPKTFMAHISSSHFPPGYLP